MFSARVCAVYALLLTAGCDCGRSTAGELDPAGLGAIDASSAPIDGGAIDGGTVDAGVACQPWFDSRVACVASVTSRITGTTPVGPINLQFSWASASWAFEHDQVLLFANSPSFDECSSSFLRVMTSIDPGVAGGDFLVRIDGGMAMTVGAVTVDVVDYRGRADGGSTRGSLRIDAPGWDVTGTFDVSYCPAFDRSGP